MHVRRALLYMPGDDWHKITKALTLGVDCICMDMEDGVAANRKIEARQTIVRALHQLDFGESEKLVRINGVGTGLEAEDIQAVLPHRPAGIVVPKIDSLEQLVWAGEQVETAELAHGWPLGSIRLVAIVESARAILSLPQIAAHPRLDALIFGGEDFSASIGATRTREATELLYARSAIVTAAAAFGLQSIDLVTIDFKDLDLVRAEAEFGARLGFTGKQIIHPAQVAPVQQAFTPDAAAIAHAQQVVAASETHQAAGAGAFALDGKMIDMPVVKAAQGVLERARAAGKI